MRLSDQDYWKRRAQLDVVSYGKLRLFAENPRAFRLSKVRERTDAMIKGSILDCLVFEPWAFRDRFAVRKVENSAGKVTLQSKAAKEEFAAIEATGKTPIRKEWVAEAFQQLSMLHMSDTEPAPWSALRASTIADSHDDTIPLHDPVTDYLAAVATHTCTAEMSILRGAAQPGIAKHNRELGLTFVAKPDFAPAKDSPYGNALVDLKLTNDISPDAWQRKIEEYAYHWQAASYLDLWNAEHPDDQRERFIWLLVENTAPFDSGLVECGYHTLHTGREEYLATAERYARCLRDNHWPSPLHTGTELPLSIELPKWHKAIGAEA